MYLIYTIVLKKVKVTIIYILLFNVQLFYYLSRDSSQKNRLYRIINLRVILVSRRLPRLIAENMPIALILGNSIYAISFVY